jgi:hypothetical protein
MQPSSTLGRVAKVDWSPMFDGHDQGKRFRYWQILLRDCSLSHVGMPFVLQKRMSSVHMLLHIVYVAPARCSIIQQPAGYVQYSRTMYKCRYRLPTLPGGSSKKGATQLKHEHNWLYRDTHINDMYCETNYWNWRIVNSLL